MSSAARSYVTMALVDAKRPSREALIFKKLTPLI